MTTAVAPALTFQSDSRAAWSPSSNGYSGVNTDDVGRMFAPAPRKAVQRQNSSSSLASTASSTSTISASSVQPSNTSTSPADAGPWGNRKKPTRGLWPSGKAEPATGISGISTARPQVVNASASGPSASSAISALHGPSASSLQGPNGATQANMASRGQHPPEVPAILHLLPMNATFERKTITVPYFPDVLRIGRQTNQKTIPTPLNGYFDSKVLSRQHAEIWADRQGRVFIRDVKSSNGTFVNGMRLSQENKESEPRELREQDVLELGIDIVSEDQKTVVHHKVAAKVEHAGVYNANTDSLGFGDLDSSNGVSLLVDSHPSKRAGSQGSVNGRLPNGAGVAAQQVMNVGMMNQPLHMRNWLNPITAEHVVKRLNAEMKMAMQQSQDLARARQTIEQILGARIEPPRKEIQNQPDRSRSSPIKPKADLKAPFSGPPAPPPQAPLPDKPDVARALADPLIQPLLRRADTARPMSVNSSPTRPDHSGDILRLCEELKLAKGELSTQNERMRTLEHELAQERSARENAEERAQQLELRGAANKAVEDDALQDINHEKPERTQPDLQFQLDRLQASMDEMKQQMEAYRRRAEVAEGERDEARKSLAELVEEKRRENSDRKAPRTPPKTPRSPSQRSPESESRSSEANGHAVSPQTGSPTSIDLLERVGIEHDQPITPDQAKLITQLLTQEVLQPRRESGKDGALSQYGRPYGSAAAVVLLGILVMTWAKGWPEVDRASLGMS